MADENKMRGSFRPMSSMIAEGVSGSPADPGLMIHEMKVAARKAAEGPTPPEPEPEPKQPKVKAGTYEGAGGYAYEVMENGAIKIVKAPKGRGLGVKLTKGMAFDAIMDELKDAEPVDSVFAEERAIFDDMLKSKERRESAMADVAGGVVPGEGRSGMAATAEPETSRKMAKK
mgnify:FL=1